MTPRIALLLVLLVTAAPAQTRTFVHIQLVNPDARDIIAPAFEAALYTLIATSPTHRTTKLKDGNAYVVSLMAMPMPCALGTAVSVVVSRRGVFLEQSMVFVPGQRIQAAADSLWASLAKSMRP